MQKNNNEIGFVELTVKTINLIKKYYIIIVCFLVFGLVLGYFMSNKKAIVSYKKKLVFFSNYVPYAIINNFTYNIINNNYRSTSTNNSIFNENNSRKIENLYLDTISQKPRVLLQVSFILTDTVGTSGIFNEYFNYLDSASYFKNIRNKNNIKNKLIYEKLCLKIDELESIQNRVNLSKNNQMVITGESYKEYVDLYSLKLEYQEKIKNKSSFEVVSESIIATAESTNRLFRCIKYAFAFLLTSFFLIFILELIKKVRSYK